ncbi:hypothetical protein ALI144C_25430 [Actinosynnema sp. ALI-1.44]|uniref:DUF3043 domain-containing protein n=1 Tax=Actinosynnema sp. ALI-1.44 TaxID=1933779 RepID=UPI00097CA159|nr:DUF3043 domain-containing protein [Actinosynnema sp. ALI-1.44]ONI79542.1 hypothetical protein ALI144C_25430 [Actinosynnema sp. ALI-1.44]
MRFLRRNSDDKADTAAVEETGVDVEEPANRAFTAGKGKPTPKRRDAEARRRGPVAPAPQTTREAMRRAKQTRPSKDERRAATAERRERMMAGDDKYLMPRDRGPVKAYVRDLVDSRRNLLGLFMPLAIVVFVALLMPNPIVQNYATLVCLAMLIMMILEGVINGRRVTKLVRERFPKETVRGASIGWYAFVRASQIRKLRVPKPRLKPGDAIPR